MDLTEMKIAKTGISYLTGANHAVWKRKMEMLLNSVDMWYTIRDPKPEVVDHAWVGANDKAMMKIILSMHDSLINAVMERFHS